MNLKRMLIPALVILLSVLACKLSGQASAEDELAETLTAEEALAQATADALRPTYEYNQTQAALPTPTVTPIGPIFDGGDGLETELIINIENSASQFINNRQATGSPEAAHNYLFSAEAGSLQYINVSERNEANDPRFTLLDPDGNILLQVDNTLGTANASAYVILPASGIYTLRVQTRLPGPYVVTTGPQSDTLYTTGDDGRITSDVRRLFGPTGYTPEVGLIGTTGEAINFLFDNRARDQPVTIRVEGSGRTDPAITLFDPDGGIVASDDNSGGDLSAELQVSLTVKGQYLIRVWMNSVDMLTPDTTENFSLSVTAE